MNNWTIGRRITVGFGLVIGVVLGLGAFSLYQFSQIEKQGEAMATDYVPCLLAISEVEARSEEGIALLYEYVNLPDKAPIEGQLRKNFESAAKSIAAYDATKPTGDDLRMWTEFKGAHTAFVTTAEAVVQAVTAGRTAEAAELVHGRAEAAFQQGDKLLDKLVEFNEGELNKANVKILSIGRTGHRWLFGGLVVSVGLALVVAYAISRSAAQSLRGIASVLEDGASQFLGAARQVASASQNLAEGASEQAASLEETSASLEEITSMVKRSADAARQTRQFAANTRTSAEEGAAARDRLKTAVDTIRDAAGEMREAVQGIKTSSGDVAKIIKSIDEIAFQTNILALNAAVEAARAGEAGMGFAVVADEVRNLAQRSARSARETADLIAAAVSQADRGVAVNERVIGAIDIVGKAAGEVGTSLQEIVQRVHQVDGQVNEIASACSEQAQGITQVNTAVSEMDKVTQGNAASAEQSASASEELNAQALSLQHQVELLLSLVGSGNGGGPRRSPELELPMAPPPHEQQADAGGRAAAGPASAGTGSAKHF